MKHNDWPLVSVIIPARNSAATMEACLRSLEVQDYPGSWEVLVVDNDSNDATATIAARFGRARVIEQLQVRSSYASRNAGVSASKGHVLAFTDADMVLAECWLKEGVAPILRGDLDIVAGEVEVELCSRPSLAARYDALTAFDQRKYVANGFCVTANMIVSREVFERVGPFLNNLISGGDAEWGQRAIRLGLRMGFVAEAKGYHPPREFRSLLQKQLRVGYGSAQHDILLAGGTASMRLWVKEFVRPPVWWARVMKRLNRKSRSGRFGHTPIWALAPMVALFALATSAGRMRALAGLPA